MILQPDDIKDNVEKEEIMKKSKQEELKIPLNYPKITIKHNKLGDLKSYYNKDTGDTIYGYDFELDKVLQFVQTKFKQEDKPYFVFKLLDRNSLSLSYKPYKGEYSWGIPSELTSKSSSKVKEIEQEHYSSQFNKIKLIEDVIKDNCLVKVNSYLESSRLFGYRPSKKGMLGNYFKIIDIDYNYYHEESKTNLSIVILSNPKNNKSLKFLIGDLVFIIPEPEQWLKSYNKPKDRNIQPGIIVRVVNDKYGSVVKNELLKVKYLDKDKYHLKIGITENRPYRGINYLDTLEATVPTFSNNRIREHLQSKKINNSSKTKVNPNCSVWCINKEGKEVKVKVKQLKVI